MYSLGRSVKPFSDPPWVAMSHWSKKPPENPPNEDPEGVCVHLVPHAGGLGLLVLVKDSMLG